MPSPFTGHVYQREDGLWDWRLVANNGRIVATSGNQGYARREKAVKMAARVMQQSHRLEHPDGYVIEPDGSVTEGTGKPKRGLARLFR